MDYTVRDLDTYKRKQHFKYFSGLAFPYVGTTAPVDITALMEKIRREGLPFFLIFCYCTLESAMPFAEYLPYAKREQERAKAARSRKARRPGRHRAAFFLRFIYILALFFCGALHYNIKSRL